MTEKIVCKECDKILRNSKKLRTDTETQIWNDLCDIIDSEKYHLKCLDHMHWRKQYRRYCESTPDNER